MKKLLVIFMFLAFALTAGAQNTAKDADLGYNQTYSLFTGATADTIGVADSLWTYTVRNKTDSKLYMYYYISLDSIGGSVDTIDVIRQKKMFTSESYTVVDTITWYGTVDTTFASLSSLVHGEYWRMVIKGRHSTLQARISTLNIKFMK